MPKMFTPEWYKAVSTQHKTRLAVRKGILIPEGNCQLCGRPDTIAHHWKGYDYPYLVWWICHSCNTRLRGRHDGIFSLEQAAFYVKHEYEWVVRRIKAHPDITVFRLNEEMKVRDEILTFLVSKYHNGYRFDEDGFEGEYCREKDRIEAQFQ